ADGCLVNLSVHPEDRFAAQYDPGKPYDGVVIVGIDNKSMNKPELGSYPISRDNYAKALKNLEAAGATVVAFDIGFPDRSTADGDLAFHDAIAGSHIPVILAYGAGKLDPGTGKWVQDGVDQIPIRDFRCADTAGDRRGACSQPLPNVILASPDLVLDQGGVVRHVPLQVQTVCAQSSSCSTPLIDTFGFAAYRAGQLGLDFKTGPDLAIADGQASFGAAWSTPASPSGTILINF